MTLTEVRKILEDYHPKSKKVREALEVIVPMLPTEPPKPTAKQRLNELRIIIQENNEGFDPFASRDKKYTTVSWRNCVFYQLRKEGYSLNERGRATGYDHSTVCTSCKKFEGYIQTKDYITTNTWKEFVKYIHQ